MLTFGIPAHNGGRGPAPDVASLIGLDAGRCDLPMSHGVDTRDRSWQVQTTAQELFAEAVGAKQTLFSTNGSSLSVHVAIMTVCGPGETLVMARNGHKSSFAGLILSGARPVYVDPYYDDELELALTPVAGDLAAALEAHPEARAALVFTPSYYGTSADVAAYAEACHARDLPLVTDDAWALDYAFREGADLPAGALEQGSDLAIGSVHKTLSGLGQTSVLSVGSDRLDTERLQLCFELEESTSEVPELRVIGVEELAGRPSVTGADPTHVLIETAPIGLTGYQADDWLRDERQVDVELVDHRRVMPLVTFAHGEAEIDRLVNALRDLADEQAGGDDDGPRLPSRREIRHEQAVLPRDAVFAPP